MNDINYFNLVQEVLIEDWSYYKQPLQMNKEDLTAGVALFTKIAVDTVVKELKESESMDKSISSNTEQLSDVVEKIKAFINDKACYFRSVCQSGFPFSLLESSLTETALKEVFEHRYNSILTPLLTLEKKGFSEEELDERFGNPFQRLQVNEIAFTCSNLGNVYIKKSDNKAGYYLLWLIKQAGGCAYEIPNKDSFGKLTVTKILSNFFTNNNINIKNKTRLVETLISRPTGESLYKQFLDRKSRALFLNFSLKQLQKIPMDKWPSKGNIILDFLEATKLKMRLKIGQRLAANKDLATSKVGNHLIAALNAPTLREALPHFYSLEEVLPQFDESNIKMIFGVALKKFRQDRSSYNDPDFTSRLHFNVRRKVFVHDSLMIGEYMDRKIVPPNLFAYDMKTQKMVWGIPLIAENPSLNIDSTRRPLCYNLKKMGETISLQWKGEKQIHFIDPKTGEFEFTLQLPAILKNRPDALHISSAGFGYQLVWKGQDSILFGGQIVDKQWKSFFEMKGPNGSFLPLASHCGFEEPFEDILVLVGPTGHQVTLTNCMAAKAEGDKLYLIEKDLNAKDKCLLTIRTLLMDKEVVFGIEKSISLNVEKASFGDLCQNGKVVLFSDSSPIFIDLNTQKVTYSTHKFPSYAERLINTQSGDLWTWDELSKQLWKVSEAGITSMGSLNSGRDTSLLHADKEDHLYFV